MGTYFQKQAAADRLYKLAACARLVKRARAVNSMLKQAKAPEANPANPPSTAPVSSQDYLKNPNYDAYSDLILDPPLPSPSQKAQLAAMNRRVAAVGPRMQQEREARELSRAFWKDPAGNARRIADSAVNSMRVVPYGPSVMDVRTLLSRAGNHYVIPYFERQENAVKGFIDSTAHNILDEEHPERAPMRIWRSIVGDRRGNSIYRNNTMYENERIADDTTASEAARQAARKKLNEIRKKW